MKRILFGLVWLVVLYLLGACAIGAVAGGQAGARARTSEEGAQRGAKAGAAAVERFTPHLMIGAIALAFCGTLAGALPGTAPQRNLGREGEQFWGLALITLVVVGMAAVPVWLVWSRPHFAPERFTSVRVGMSDAEVEALVGAPPGDYSGGGAPTGTFTNAEPQKTWLGPDQALTVFLDPTGDVVDTRVYPVHRPLRPARPK